MRRDATNNREKLVASAEEVFAVQGPTATLDDVAAAAGVGPATLYRRFANKDALVREVLAAFFQRLIDAAEVAEQAPAGDGVELFLRTVGVELAEKSGLSAPVWGDLAPRELVTELRRRSAGLLTRAQSVGAVRADLTPEDITIAVWALRGVVQSERIDPAHRGRRRWQRHLDTIMRGFSPAAERPSREP